MKNQERKVRVELQLRMEDAVRILSEGVCLQVEVEHRLGLYGGSAKRLFDALADQGFVERQLFVSGQTKYAVIRLTEKGAAFAAERGYPIHESEWDVLVEHHNAEVHSQHAFAVLLFAFQARRRGWRVEVCPPVNNKRFMPDVLVEKDGERWYVEVEVLRHPRKRKDGFGADNTWIRKWRNQVEYQGRVAVCTLTPKRMQGIVRYLKPRWRGMATELTTLAKNPYSDLWLERWERTNEVLRR